MNLYLEKIARQLSEEEIKYHGHKAFRNGTIGGIGGSLVLPGIGGMVGGSVGRSIAISDAKSAATGKPVDKSDVTGESIRSWFRGAVRGGAESIPGAIGGGALGAAIGHGIAKTMRLRVDPHMMTMGAGFTGAGIGAVGAALHGNRASSINSMRDFSQEWERDK